MCVVEIKCFPRNHVYFCNLSPKYFLSFSVSFSASWWKGWTPCIIRTFCRQIALYFYPVAHTPSLHLSLSFCQFMRIKRNHAIRQSAWSQHTTIGCISFPFRTMFVFNYGIFGVLFWDKQSSGTHMHTVTIMVKWSHWEATANIIEHLMKLRSRQISQFFLVHSLFVSIRKGAKTHHYPLEIRSDGEKTSFAKCMSMSWLLFQRVRAMNKMLLLNFQNVLIEVWRKIKSGEATC